MPINKRILSLMLIDAILVVLALHISLLIKFDFSVPHNYWTAAHHLSIVAILIYVACFNSLNLYRRMWEYASTRELIAILGASTIGSLIFGTLVLVIDWTIIPRSVHIINWAAVVGLIGFSRMSWRVFRDRVFVNASEEKPRALIVGAGEAGAIVVRELRTNGNGAAMTPVGFVDDNIAKGGMLLRGFKVLGTRHDIPRLVRRHRVDNIIIAMPSAPGEAVREILEICRETDAKVKIVPGVYELIDGSVSVKRIRDVELEDLLHREPVKINLEEIAGYLNDKVVMVTGAGGSIGSELCRQVCRFRPKKLILLELSENNLYEVEMELGNLFPGIDIEPCLADIKDNAKLNRVFNKYRPQVIFHAAAHKHVPMMEKNPDEAVKNNIIGTRNVAMAADRVESEIFIMISTDKAVNPTSVMGTTKRIAEMTIHAVNQRSKTRFAAVRFGNVLGSQGSVIPLFKRQIAKGGPITITHPEMKRFFMTIPEAVQLVIQAGSMARGGETFVLDMGKPVRIIDLAKDLIKLSGLRPDKDIPIKITGMRPGEKLYEELFTREESHGATTHERILIAYENGDDYLGFEKTLLNRLEKVGAFGPTEIITMLEEMVPEFMRQETHTG